MPGDSTRFNALLAALDRLANGIERLAPSSPGAIDWSFLAYRWAGADHPPPLKPVSHPHAIGLADLLCIDRQKSLLERNTRQFLRGLPANNALLWGSRGTGKSSLVKALLHDYADSGLKLIEVDKTQLIDLPDILDCIRSRPERFILFSDDLSFESGEPGYKALKAVLDGSLSALSGNALIYATSNRRHLLPEYMSENLDAKSIDGEIHQGETVEEKISLSERFGLWISFHPFSQDDYLSVVRQWLEKLGTPGVGEDWETIRAEALRWALARGSRSGRVAWQFARDWCGQQLLNT
ncbi:MAG: ATP-binding protein [Methylococcus sp.]|nr:ATP-binding protein [Methylococcus sp.]